MPENIDRQMLDDLILEKLSQINTAFNNIERSMYADVVKAREGLISDCSLQARYYDLIILLQVLKVFELNLPYITHIDLSKRGEN